MSNVTDAINATNAKDEKDIKGKIVDLTEGASPERLEAILVLLNLDDARAVSYGEALSLLEESEYNVSTLRMAISKVKDEQGLHVVRTRTRTRVFKFYKDEDDPDSGFSYRGFYVKMTNPEQKIAISTHAAERVKLLLSGISEKDMRDNPAKLLDSFKGEAFQSFLIQPNKAIRKIVKANMVEVDVIEGKVSKPVVEQLHDNWDDVPEFIFIQLEEDLNLLMEQQGVIAKNSHMTDMFEV